MAPSYSPGPWFAVRFSLGEGFVYLVRTQAGTPIAGVYSGQGLDEAQAEANAQAIAALPDLVAACDAAVAVLLSGATNVTPAIEVLARALTRIRQDWPDRPSGPLTPTV